MTDAAEFLFITCQVGAESAVKGEIARLWADFRFAYSRPGFLTFKLPSGHGLADDFDLNSVFARAYGFSLGKVPSSDPEAVAEAGISAMGDRACEVLHVWPRDAAPAGYRGYDPGQIPESIAIEAAIRSHWPERANRPALSQTATARFGQLVLDCIWIDPGLCWLGYHRAAALPSRWPGGLCSIELPPDAVSRAYLKMEEAMRWSQFPIKPGQRAAEIGAGPGGASQALLNRGLLVTGIDPAHIDPKVTSHPNFTHIRKRGADVRRREFRKIRWLVADMNVAPTYTLDTIEGIVTHDESGVRGLMLTLKLLDWGLAEHVPEYLERVRSWGFVDARARQLHHNRQEVCVVASRPRR